MSERSADKAERVVPSDADMSVFDAIYSLRATRRFQDAPIPKEHLDQVLQAGTMAGSSGNTQPWEYVVITETITKRQLKVLMEGAYREIDGRRAQTPDQMLDGSGRSVTGHTAIEYMTTVPVIVAVCWNPDRGIRMKNEYIELPDGKYKEAAGVYGDRGSSLFHGCQNMMLAAHALGISSLFARFFLMRSEEVKELLGIPPRMFLECSLFLGYSDERLGGPRRKPLHEVAHLDKWGVAFEIGV